MMPDHVDFPPNGTLPVSAWSGELIPGARLSLYRAATAQALFCFDGLMRVEAGEDRWFIPDRFGIWIPPGTVPHVDIIEPLEFQSVLLNPRFSGRIAMPQHPVVLRASPLMRGIARRLMTSDQLTRPEQRRLGWVALDEIARLDRPDMHLPGSRNPRLARVMDHLLTHPRDAGSLAQIAALAGVSERTLSRLFPSETGMTWRDWRDRMRFVLAIEGLQMGRRSTDLANTLGYSSPSAFIAAFRRHSGLTPTEWRQQR